MLARLLPLAAAMFLSLPTDAAAKPRASAVAVYPAGMVSAADPRAAAAGAAMLRAGGSATDAAIATMLALNVVEPQSSGIGGGGFLVRGDATGVVSTIDGRETAPRRAGGGWFLGPDGKPLRFGQAVNTGLSVGVPGNLALAAEAYRRWGRLRWRALFAPAIALARGGWTITPRLREMLALARESAAHDPAGRALFFDAAGAPLPVGTTIREPALAATLARIARAGAASFYAPASAARLSARVRAETPASGGGGMTADDVERYAAKPRPPVCGAYRVYRICGMGPPSSGATTVYAIVKQLERFDMAAYPPTSPVAWHLIAESERLAYADRERYLADSDFVSVPVAGLTDLAYLAARGTLIRADATLPTVLAGSPRGVSLAPPVGVTPVEHGTSHFVAIDRRGEAVSYTSTIEAPFGSGLMTGGFYLNNELTDFSFAPDQDGVPVANRVEGGKRPRSAMAPTLVYGPDGRLLLAVGAAGGATIPAQVARVLIGVLDWKLPLDRALALPVLFVAGDGVIVERGSALEPMIPALRALGHADVRARALPLKTNAVMVVNRALVGAADPRSEGRAIEQ